jgi:hypothetical protein
VRPHHGSPDDDAMSPAGPSAREAESDPSERLAALVESERDHAVAGRIDELREIQAQEAALVAALPEQAPDGARPYLLRAAAARAEVTTALATALRVARADAMRIDHGRTAMAAYRPATPAAPGIARRG